MVTIAQFVFRPSGSACTLRIAFRPPYSGSAGTWKFVLTRFGTAGVEGLEVDLVPVGLDLRLVLRAVVVEVPPGQESRPEGMYGVTFESSGTFSL